MDTQRFVRSWPAGRCDSSAFHRCENFSRPTVTTQAMTLYRTCATAHQWYRIFLMILGNKPETAERYHAVLARSLRCSTAFQEGVRQRAPTRRMVVLSASAGRVRPATRRGVRRAHALQRADWSSLLARAYTHAWREHIRSRRHGASPVIRNTIRPYSRSR